MTIHRKNKIEMPFTNNADTNTQVYPSVTAPTLGAAPVLRISPRGKLRAVRLRYAASQTKVLVDVRLRILMEVGQPNPSSDDFLLYDTGVLAHGVIPSGGTVAIVLTGSDSTCFWLDEMGADGPCWGGGTFYDRNGLQYVTQGNCQLRFELIVNSTGGPAAGDELTVCFDTEEEER